MQRSQDSQYLSRAKTCDNAADAAISLRPWWLGAHAPEGIFVLLEQVEAAVLSKEEAFSKQKSSRETCEQSHHTATDIESRSWRVPLM